MVLSAPRFCRGLQAGCVDVRDKHPRATGSTSSLQCQQPDHACADHQRRLAAFDVRDRHCVKRHRNRFQHRRLRECQVVRQLVHDPRRHGNVLRESSSPAVIAARDANHLPVIAQIRLALATKVAHTAVNRRVERDTIAHGEFTHLGADAGNNACGLMPHDNGRNPSPRGAVVSMNVTAADATSGHLYQHVELPRYRNW